MLLSDRDLNRAIKDGRLAVDPFEPELVQPSSIDVRLDQHLLVWPPVNAGGWYEVSPAIDPAIAPYMLPVDMEGRPYVIGPGEMLLASTLERVTVGNGLAARVEGKSSIGRLGLAVHVTAGFVDPGFSGHITLELVNHNPRPLVLHPGMRIGQLCVFRMTSPAELPYGATGVGSHYQGQRGPTASRAWQNFRTWTTRREAA